MIRSGDPAWLLTIKTKGRYRDILSLRVYAEARLAKRAAEHRLGRHRWRHRRQRGDYGAPWALLKAGETTATLNPITIQ